MKQTEKNIPNWILFLFFGSLVGGLIYSIFLHGFLDYDISHSFREANGTLYVEPKLSIIPVRNSQAIQSGKETYGRVCIACHGVYGKHKAGLVGVDLADSKWLHYNNETKIASLVIKGVNQTQSITKQVMPARAGGSLSDQAIWQVVYYLSAKNRSIVKDAKPTE